VDVEVDAVDGDDVSIGLADPGQADVRDRA